MWHRVAGHNLSVHRSGNRLHARKNEADGIDCAVELGTEKVRGHSLSFRLLLYLRFSIPVVEALSSSTRAENSTGSFPERRSLEKLYGRAQGEESCLGRVRLK